MSFDFYMPDIGEGVVEGEIVGWKVKEGDRVTLDQPIVEVMTDKATVELPSPRAGVIAKINYKDGSICPVGKILVVIEEDGAPTKKQVPPPGHHAHAAPAPAAPKAAAQIEVVDVSESRERVLATPATRRLARQLGVEIGRVPPTGKHGRVTTEDVKSYQTNGPTTAIARTRHAPVSIARNTLGYEEERIPLRGMRKKIADAMSRSVHTAAHFTYVEEIDMTELVLVRDRAKARAAERGVKLNYLPFIIKAIVSGLKKWPQLNASLDETTQEIVRKKYYHIGVAAQGPQGLVVSVVRDADLRSIFDLSKEIDRLGDAVRNNTATRDDLTGSTFTVSSLGKLGGVLATPIINFPEVAVVGVHKIEEKPAVRNGQIVIRHLMNLSISVDHRLADGWDGAMFIQDVKTLLEDPTTMFMEMIEGPSWSTLVHGVGRNDRSTTSADVYVDERPSTNSSWYLIVSGSGHEMSSRVVPIHDVSELLFGRIDECDIKVDHDGVSRRHAKVKRRGDHVQVEDLGSRNGTVVNGTPITAPRRLAVGDVIVVGPASAIVASSSTAKRTRQVATVSEFEDRFDAEVDRAVRYQRPLGLVMLRIEGPVELMTDHVETLVGQLRRMDVVAEYGAEELALVLPETDRDATIAVARRSAAVPVGLSAGFGTASFPEDGSHVGELIGVARDRLRGVDRDSRPAGAPNQPVVVDPLMEQVMALAKRVAPSAITVLVVGETGVGKEVIAEQIHRLSPRRAGPFVRLNCASLSEALVESELFGATKPGFLEAASTGTLFLDEIGELPLNTQGKLLRALEQQSVVRVGSTRETPTDVRLVCATNRDLEAEVSRGRFRDDLYFRISAFVIPIPPLRDRRTEIEPLALHFARELSPAGRTATVGPEVLEVLDAYAWPGNVRELRNVIERACVMSAGARIEPHHLPDRLLEKLAHSSTTAPAIDVRQRVADVERESVLDALEATNGNQTKAARKLGISRFALIRLMQKHDLNKR